jgi:hypothetical protein
VQSTSTAPNSTSCCDEHGAELDILLQKRRDKAAAKRFFKRVPRSNPAPRKIVTDQLRSYRAAKADIPELVNVKHVFVKAAARVNNRAENSHQPTQERERRLRGFRDPKRTQAFPVELRSHPAALRTETVSAALLCLSQTPRDPVRRVAGIYQRHPDSVECVLSHSTLCHQHRLSPAS